MAKFDKTAQIAMVAGAAIVATAVAGVAAYNASVRRQICSSYEIQLNKHLDVGSLVVGKLNSMMMDIQEEIVPAHAYSWEIDKAKVKHHANQEKVNDALHAYRNSCDSERVRRFSSRFRIEDREFFIDRVEREIQGFFEGERESVS